MTSLADPPYIATLEKNSKGEYEFSGIYPDIFFTLQDIMNFTYVLTPPSDGHYGTLSSDGVTWTGMVGLLQAKEMDIGKFKL